MLAESRTYPLGLKKSNSQSTRPVAPSKWTATYRSRRPQERIPWSIRLSSYPGGIDLERIDGRVAQRAGTPATLLLHLVSRRLSSSPPATLHRIRSAAATH